MWCYDSTTGDDAAPSLRAAQDTVNIALNLALAIVLPTYYLRYKLIKRIAILSLTQNFRELMLTEFSVSAYQSRVRAATNKKNHSSIANSAKGKL